MSILLPESAPVRAILLSWPYAESDWGESLVAAEECYWGILEAMSARPQQAEVWVLLHPSIDQYTWRSATNSQSVDFAQVKIITDIAYNDTWIRDYGPLSLTTGYCSFVFNGWGQKFDATLDNTVAEKLSTYYGHPFTPFSQVVEGGALEINEQGILLANLDCVVDELRNPGVTRSDLEKQLQLQLGIREFIWLENIDLTGDDTDGHIDTIARYGERDSIVCCGRDQQHHDATALENLNAQLEKICDQKEWSLYSLPVPVVRSKLDGRILPATYTNYLLANRILYAPIYGVEQDPLALNVLNAAYPSYSIVPVQCEALLEQHGSLHCATMQLSICQ